MQARSEAEQARTVAEQEAKRLHSERLKLSGDMEGATRTLHSLREDLKQAQWTSQYHEWSARQLWECCWQTDTRMRQLIGAIVPDKLNRPCSTGGLRWLFICAPAGGVHPAWQAQQHRPHRWASVNFIFISVCMHLQASTCV